MKRIKSSKRPTVNMTDAGHRRLRNLLLQYETETGVKLNQGSLLSA